MSEEAVVHRLPSRWRLALRRVWRSPMGRQSVLLGCSLAGVIVGAALIARWAVGLAVIADSVFGVWFALMRDVDGQPQVTSAGSHEAVIARYRGAP